MARGPGEQPLAKISSLVLVLVLPLTSARDGEVLFAGYGLARRPGELFVTPAHKGGT